MTSAVLFDTTMMITGCVHHLRTGDDDIAALACSLSDNTMVKRVDYSWRLVSDAGAVTLADAFKVNTTVTMIHLCGNQIGDEGAIAFANMLKTNTTLRVISFYCNEISDVGGVALAEALELNTSVTYADMSYNRHMSKSVYDQIQRYCAENKRLPRVHAMVPSLVRIGVYTDAAVALSCEWNNVSPHRYRLYCDRQ